MTPNSCMFLEKKLEFRDNYLMINYPDRKVIIGHKQIFDIALGKNGRVLIALKDGADHILKLSIDELNNLQNWFFKRSKKK